MTSDAAARPAEDDEAAVELRFEILNAFVDGGMAGLSRAELAVWLILYRDTKPDGTARTSLDDLARRGGMDRQTASPGGRPAGAAEDAPGGPAGRLEPGTVDLPRLPVSDGVNAHATVGAGAYSTVGISLPAL